MAISTFPSAGGGAPVRTEYVERITATGTWTAPGDVTKVQVALCGGGGSGAAFGNTANSGGGGSLQIEELTVVPGTAYTITIGAGGARVNSQAPGNAGVASSFGALLTAAGAPGGYSNILTMGNTKYGGDPGRAINAANTTIGEQLQMGRQMGGTIFENYPIGGRGGGNDSNKSILQGGPGSGSINNKAGNPNSGAGGIGGFNQTASNSGAGGSGVCIIKYWSAL